MERPSIYYHSAHTLGDEKELSQFPFFYQYNNTHFFLSSVIKNCITNELNLSITERFVKYVSFYQLLGIVSIVRFLDYFILYFVQESLEFFSMYTF